MIMQTIESETFAGVKELISEEPIRLYYTQKQNLDTQVQQLSPNSTKSQLANFLGSIGNKLIQGGSMDQFEYRAVNVSYSHNVLNRHKWQNNLQKKQNIPQIY